MSERSSVEESAALQPSSSGPADQETSVDASPGCPSKVLIEFFTEFLELEETVKRASSDKAQLFKRLRDLGVDSTAARVAYRRCKRELDSPGSLKRAGEQDENVTKYLLYLSQGLQSPRDVAKRSTAPMKSVAQGKSAGKGKRGAGSRKKALGDIRKPAPRSQNQVETPAMDPGCEELGSEGTEEPDCTLAKADRIGGRRSQEERDRWMKVWQEEVSGG